MSELDTNYSTYSEIDPGPELHSAVEEIFLTHTCYVSLALCELREDETGNYTISIVDLMNKVNEIIFHLHQDKEIYNVVFDYFNQGANLISLLQDLDDSGFISLYETIVRLSRDQMDYLRTCLMDIYS